MFSPSPWSRDTFERLNFSHISTPIYNTRMSPSLDPHTHGSSRRRRHGSHFAAEGPEFSEQSTTDDRCFLNDETPLPDRLYSSYWTDHQKSSYYSEPPPDPLLSFKKVAFKMPLQTAEKAGLEGDHVLILPQAPTRLRVQMQTQRGGGRVKVAVAGDMRFRDVVKQLLPAHYSGEVRACVKLRGEWQEPGPSMKVSDLVEQRRFGLDEAGEIEVKIDLRGGRRKGMGVGMGMDMDVGMVGGERREMRGWERAMGAGRESLWMY